MTQSRKPEKKAKREWLTVWGAAREMKTTHYTVLMNIATGKLRTHEFNDRVYVSRESVEALMAAS